MKFCRFCGAELREGMRFCTKCGAAVQPAAPAPARVEEPIAAIPTPPPAQPAAPVQPQPQAPAAAAAKKPIPRWLVLLVIAAAAFAVFWFFIRKDPVQDVKDFVFYDYGAIPFGTVVDSVMPGTTWSSTGGGSTYMVTMSGMYDFVPISATFQVTYSGSVPYVRFLSASVMGETVSDPEGFVPGLYAI